jgi:hypothetical protein
MMSKFLYISILHGKYTYIYIYLHNIIIYLSHTSPKLAFDPNIRTKLIWKLF